MRYLLFNSAIFVVMDYLISGISCEDSPDQEVKKYEIVPDVISVPPLHSLHISFNQVDVNFGNELSPAQVKNQPTLVDYPIDEGTYYTLSMVDPDAPSRQNPKAREWNHWLVTNIPGINIAKGTILTPYMGSTPPKDTGLHRYVCLVYKQPKKLEFSDASQYTKRGGFKIAKFAKEHNLGNPWAGNFFQAKS